MSCYLFDQENLKALKKGERLFVPGIDPEKYDCWEIEYARELLVVADNYFGVSKEPKNGIAKILAIRNETEKEAVDRFTKWCEHVYSMVSHRSPVFTVITIRYVKAEENEDA